MRPAARCRRVAENPNHVPQSRNRPGGIHSPTAAYQQRGTGDAVLCRAGADLRGMAAGPSQKGRQAAGRKSGTKKVNYQPLIQN